MAQSYWLDPTGSKPALKLGFSNEITRSYDLYVFSLCPSTRLLSIRHFTFGSITKFQKYMTEAEAYILLGDATLNFACISAGTMALGLTTFLPRAACLLTLDTCSFRNSV